MAFSDKQRKSDHAQVDNDILIAKVVSQEVTPTAVNVRVMYPDREGLISKPIPVLQRRTRGMRSMDCPAIGTNVKVSRLSNGLEEGFVDGEFYTTENPPPQIDPNQCSWTEFPDGSVVHYDPSGIGLIMDLKSHADIKTVGDVTIDSAVEALVKSAYTCTVEAPNILLKGNTRIEGTLDVTQPVMFEQGGQTGTGNITNADGSGGGS